MGAPMHEIIDGCLLAFRSTENRLEPIYEIVNLCRLSESYRLGYEIGKNYLNFPVPEDSLFLNPDVYQWKFDDEVSICAYWTGHYNHLSYAKSFSLPLLPEGERGWRVIEVCRGRYIPLSFETINLTNSTS